MVERDKENESEQLVSVIVPVYNVEEYLKRCVTSVCDQTYRNLEIILIDDGSTDNSGKICDESGRRDFRIKVIHKKNGGLADARNAGLDIATGEYVTFVDSDDWIRTDYVETLVRTLQYGKTRISACAYRRTDDRVDEQIKEIRDIDYPAQVDVWPVFESYQHLFLAQQIDCSAWAKLYERALFREIRFPIGKLYEDQFITYKLFHYAQGVSYIDQEMYFYFNRRESIQNEAFTIRKMDELEANLECVAFIKEQYPQLLEMAVCRLVSSCFHMLFAIRNREEWTKEAEQLEQIIRQNRKNMVIGKNINKKVRLGCLCSYAGFKLTRWIYLRSGVQGKINI